MMHITRSQDHIELTVPIKRYFPFVYVFGVGLFAMLIILFVDLITVFVYKNSNNNVIYLGHLLLFPVFLFYGLWFINGKETVSIDEKKMKVIKTNGVFYLKKEFVLKEIKEIEVRHLPLSDIESKVEKIRESKRAFPFWIKMGHVSFRYNNKEVSILNGLNNEEIDTFSSILKQFVSNEYHSNSTFTGKDL